MLESYSRVWTSQKRRQERGNRYRHGRRSTRSRHTRRGGSRGLRSGLCAPSESQGPRPQGMGEGRCAQQPPRAAAARRSVAAADEEPSPQHTLPLGLKQGGEKRRGAGCAALPAAAGEAQLLFTRRLPARPPQAAARLPAPGRSSSPTQPRRRSPPPADRSARGAGEKGSGPPQLDGLSPSPTASPAPAKSG